MDMRLEARRVAEEYDVFPVALIKDEFGETQKVPAYGNKVAEENGWLVNGKGGFYLATADLDRVDAYWSGRQRDAAIGVATGSSGIVVIDDDTGKKHEAAGAPSLAFIEKHRAELMATRVHRTTSGGMHYIFEASEIEVHSRKAFGSIDVRGTSGFVVWPPSLGYSVINDVLPAQMSEALMRDLLAAQRDYRKVSVSKTGSDAPDDSLIDHIKRGVDFHDATLELTKRWAKVGVGKEERAARIKQIYDSADAALESHSDHGRWRIRRADSVRLSDGAERFLNAGLDDQQMMDMMMDIRDLGDRFVKGIEAKPVEPNYYEWEQAEDGEPAPFAGFFQPSHLRPAAERKPRDFLLGKHIRRGFISITSAAGGVGKSSLLLREIVSMVTGQKITHEDVYYPSLKVVMISEDPMADEMEHRLSALVEVDLGLDWSQYEDRFRIGRLSGSTKLFAEEHGTVVPTKFYDLLMQTEMDVLVIDPLGGVLGIEEDNNSAISQAMTYLADLAQNCGCGIELIHHSTKEGRKAINGEDINSAVRGAGAITDRVRSARTIRSMTEKEATAYDVADKLDYIAPFYGKANNSKLGLGGWYVKEIVANMNVRDGVHTGVFDPVVKPVHLEKVDMEKELATDIPAAVDALRDRPQEEMRKDIKSSGWVGVAIAEALELDIGHDVSSTERTSEHLHNRDYVKRIIETMLAATALVELDASQIVPDRKGNRRPTYFYNGRDKNTQVLDNEE